MYLFGSGALIGTPQGTNQTPINFGLIQELTYDETATTKPLYGQGRRALAIGAGTITANYDGARKYRTTVGERAFLGVDTMLVAPVTVGDGAKTGAGAVVLHDVPPGRTVVGVPARLLEPKGPPRPGEPEG